MNDIVSVYAVFGSQEEAEKIGRAMVEQQLAACVNMLGAVRSIYRWEGQIETGAEVAALFKTSNSQADPLVAAIAELHSYDVPAICHWPARSLPDYARWVLEHTGPAT